MALDSDFRLIGALSSSPEQMYAAKSGAGFDPYPLSTTTAVTGVDPGPQFFLNADQRSGPTDNGKISYTIDQAANQIVRGQPGWSHALGQGFTVTYAYRADAPLNMPDDSAGFQPFNPAQIAQAELAIQAWSDVANIHFVRVGSGLSGPGAYSDAATILFGDYTSGVAGAAAFGEFPGSTSFGSVAGDVWINSTFGYNASPTVGNYGGQVLVHELGHAIGLDHPSDYNAEANVSITYAADASYYEDSRQYTVMSYFNEYNTGGDFGPLYSAAPLLDDIAAAQLEYGPNMTTRTGDTIYGFNSNTGEPWYTIANGASKTVFAVWDAGGKDTLDFSGYSQFQTIDLRQGFFSSVGGLVGNVTIAQNADVENAIGGSGSDSINGNALGNSLSGGAGADSLMGLDGSDTLAGGAGDDLIDGGAGTDTAVFGADRTDVVVSYAGGAFHLTDASTVGAGADTVTNTEYFSFDGATIPAERALFPSDAAIGDFNGDGQADILWRNQNGGATAVWQMAGIHVTAAAPTDATVGTPWTLIGSGDFNGDGKSDLLWRNDLTGTTAVWALAGAHVSGAGLTSSQAGNDWFVAGIGDYDGDGKSDLLWRNLDSGDTALWFMNGSTVLSVAHTAATAANDWVIVGTGDFNGDGKADILWRSAGNGATFVWLMNGATTISTGFTTSYAPSPWVLGAVADFNGDGRDDLAWRNGQTGQTVIWTMNGATVTAGGLTDAAAPSGWSIVGAGDFDGDGKADLLWRNDATGSTDIWQMNGQHLLSSGLTDAFAPSGWVFA